MRINSPATVIISKVLFSYLVLPNNHRAQKLANNVFALDSLEKSLSIHHKEK